MCVTSFSLSLFLSLSPCHFISFSSPCLCLYPCLSHSPFLLLFLSSVSPFCLSPSLTHHSLVPLLSVSASLSLCLTLSLSLCLSFCLSVFLSVSLSFSLVSLSVSVFLCLCLSVSFSLSICLSVSVSVSAFLSLSLCLSLSLYVSLSLLSFSLSSLFLSHLSFSLSHHSLYINTGLLPQCNGWTTTIHRTSTDWCFPAAI